MSKSPSASSATSSSAPDAVLRQLIAWGERREEIRAMLLYSSRAALGAPVDYFSDYDVLTLLRDEADVRRFRDDDEWLEGFGRVMVVFRNPLEFSYGFTNFGYVTHYADGTKIDYTFYPAAFLDWLSRQLQPTEDLDLGYTVLLDKDGRATHLPAPTGSAYITPPPTEREYRELIDAFFNDSCYVAKCLWREDLFLAKHCLDEVMKNECLRVMLEWHIKDLHGWSIRTGAHGKGLKRQVDPEVWKALEETYVGAGFEENWQALFRTIELFRAVAKEVGAKLGYGYPQETDGMVMEYLRRTRVLRKGGGI